MVFPTTNGRLKVSGAGFTLIELLVVMLIIGSLLTIAAPRYMNSVRHSRETVLAQDLAVLREAIDQYFGDKGNYPGDLEDLASERYIRKIPIDPITKTADSRIVVLSRDSESSGIVDIRSGSNAIDSSGTPYSEW